MKKSSTICCAIVIAVILGVTVGRWWSRRNESPALAPSSPPSRKTAPEWRRLWSQPIGDRVSSPPAPLNDGWVIASDNGMIKAFDVSGKMRWNHALTNLFIVGSPAIAGQTVVVASDDGQVVALDAECGTYRWRIKTGSIAMLSGPLAIFDGTFWMIVLISSEDGILYTFVAESGQLIWQSKPTNRCDGSPSGDHRYLAYGNCDSAIHIFDTQTGEQRASVAVGEDSQMAGGLAFNGSLFFGGTRAGMLVAADAAQGTLAWQIKLSDAQEFNTPIVVDNHVAMGTETGDIVMLNAQTGETKWRITVGTAVSGLCDEAHRLFAIADGALIGIHAEDGKRFMRHAIGDSVLGPVANQGRIAVVDDGNNLIVFGTTETLE